MPSRIITREDVARKLTDWAAGRVSSEEIFAWADKLYPFDDVEYTDWENDENSITNEVLAALEMVDMNLVLPEDVPMYLEFLSTPAGQFQTGYARLQQRLAKIDFERRRKQLRDVQPYARILQKYLD